MEYRDVTLSQIHAPRLRFCNYDPPLPRDLVILQLVLSSLNPKLKLDFSVKWSENSYKLIFLKAVANKLMKLENIW